MKGQDPHRITADAEKGRVPQADQPTEAQCDVQPDSRQREDHRAGGQRDRERLFRQMRPKRNGHQPGQKKPVQMRLADHARAPNSPVGRQIRIAPIRI